MVEAKGNSDLKVEIKIRQHEMTSAVTEDLGGHDEGPDPHELVESALAACTILTVQMYARRKQFKLSGIETTVKITAESKTQTQMLRQIKLIGELSPEEKARLLEIANKCP